MSIKYDDIAAARELILSEIKASFPGIPLSVDHYILVEHRLQTLIDAGLLEGTDAEVTSSKLTAEIERKKDEI